MDERKFLFNQFLTDKRIYNLNVSYWRRKLQLVLGENISSQEQFLQNKDNQGRSFYDGNPIFSHYSILKNKAIRIIQENPADIDDYTEIKLIDAWIDKILMENKNENDVLIDELVISLFLTNASVDKCLWLIRDWYSENLNDSNIDTLLNV